MIVVKLNAVCDPILEHLAVAVHSVACVLPQQQLLFIHLITNPDRLIAHPAVFALRLFRHRPVAVGVDYLLEFTLEPVS